MKNLNTYLMLLAILIWAGCAKMGSPPGGPEDKLPPEVISTYPEAGSTNVDVETTIRIEFDEGIRTTTLAKAFAFSPLPLGNVRADWKGRTLELKFSEPLIDDKTYVLTLGSELSDLRGNKLKDAFILPFSTGDKLDKGYVKGKLKTDDGVTSGWTLVGYYIGLEPPSVTSSVSDPDPSKDIPDAMTQTSEDGSWNLTNLKEGLWRVFGYNDADRDKLWTPWLEPLAIPAYDVQALEDSTFVPRELFLIAANPDILPFPQRVYSRQKDNFEIKFDRKPERIDAKYLLVPPPDTLNQDEIEGYESEDLNLKIKSLTYKTGDSSTVVLQWENQLKGSEAWLSISGAFGTAEMLDTTLYVNLMNSSEVDSFPPVLVLQDPEENSRVHKFKPWITLIFNEPVQQDFQNGLQIFAGRDTIYPEYYWAEDNILKLDMRKYSIDGRFSVRLFGDSLKDMSGNKALDSLITLSYTKLPLDSLGEITGSLLYDKNRHQVNVIAESISKKDQSLKTQVDSSGNFHFEGLPQGYWRLEAWKDVSRNNKWYSGKAFPYFPSDPYVISGDTIYVRARWESGSAEIIFP